MSPPACKTAALVLLAILAGTADRAQAGATSAPGGPPLIAIDLPAQPLGRSINALSRQAGVAIAVDARLVQGKHAPRLSARLPLEAAMARLLHGTGLEAVAQPGGGYALRPTPRPPDRDGPVSTNGPVHTIAGVNAFTLAGVNVFASLEESVGVGGKSEQILRQVPKSVSVMTRDRVEIQSLRTLQDVLIQATGITTGAFTPLSTLYYARGMRLQTLQFDGGAPAYTGGLSFSYTPDTAPLERVELLRGVDGMYSGAGEPGGVINLVRKRPRREAATVIELSAGTWDHYRATLDVTGPMTRDGRLRGRAVVSHTDRRYFQDRYTSDKKIAYGIVEFDASDATLLSFGLNHELRRDDGYSGFAGVSRYADGTPLDLPREYSIAPDWARYHTQTTEWFAKLDQQYGETGLVRLNLTRIEQRGEIKQVLSFGAVNPATGQLPVLYGSHERTSPVQDMADLSASGQVDLFGHAHRYTVGTDYAKLDGAGLRAYRMEGLAYSPLDGRPLDYATYDPRALAEPASTLAADYPVYEQSQRGYYATVGLQLAESLRLTLGGRYGMFRYHHLYRSLAEGTVSRQYHADRRLVGSAALGYDLSERWSTYVSYGETFKAQSHLLRGPMPGTPLPPMTGDNLEVGIKGDMFAGMTAALAFYRLNRSGEGVQDPAQPAGAHMGDGAVCCYIDRGEVRVQGMDLEVSGTLSPGWQMFGGYAFTHAAHDGSPSAALTLGRTPRHQLKLWSTYRLPGHLMRWTLNGGVITQSRTRYAGLAYGGMTVWNAGVRYDLDPHWTLGLSADNLTDKHYRQAIGNIDRQNLWGSPRSLILVLRGAW